MRIAYVHSFYRSNSPSGESLSVPQWLSTLESAGHETLFVTQSTDYMSNSALYPLKAALWVASGTGADPTSALLNFKPDVVHIHNLFPNFSTNWLERWTGPVVSTLHNYRPLCANGMLYRNGVSCTACPDGKPTSSFLHGCYRDSRLATLPITLRQMRNDQRDPVIERSDRVVVLSDLAREIYESYGVSADKIDVIPSLAWREFDRASMPTEKYWVYVGRIENPKGLIDLLRIWPTHEKLKVVGTGPNMSEAIEETGNSTNVDFLGFVSDDDLRQILQGATGFIFPSRWPETQGMAACEAWGAGIPVVALQGNAIAPLCIQHQIGATYADRDSDSLNGALKHITIAGEPMRRRAQEFFNVTYSRQRWLTLTEESYSKVMGESQR